MLGANACALSNESEARPAAPLDFGGTLIEGQLKKTSNWSELHFSRLIKARDASMSAPLRLMAIG